MNYYNEAKTERAIQRKAMFFTFAIIFLTISGIYFTTTEAGREVLPDTIKEWFEQDKPKDETRPFKDKA